MAELAPTVCIPSKSCDHRDVSLGQHTHKAQKAVGIVARVLKKGQTGYLQRLRQENSIETLTANAKDHVERLAAIYKDSEDDVAARTIQDLSDEEPGVEESGPERLARATLIQEGEQNPAVQLDVDDGLSDSGNSYCSEASCAESCVTVSNLQDHDLDMRNFDPKTWFEDVSSGLNKFKGNFFQCVDQFKAMKQSIDDGVLGESALLVPSWEDDDNEQFLSGRDFDAEVTQRQADTVLFLTRFGSKVSLAAKDSKMKVEKQKEPKDNRCPRVTRRARLLKRLSDGDAPEMPDDGPEEVHQSSSHLLAVLGRQQRYMAELNAHVARQQGQLAMAKAALLKVREGGGTAPRKESTTTADIQALLDQLRTEAKQRTQEKIQKLQKLRQSGSPAPANGGGREEEESETEEDLQNEIARLTKLEQDLMNSHFHVDIPEPKSSRSPRRVPPLVTKQTFDAVQPTTESPRQRSLAKRERSVADTSRERTTRLESIEVPRLEGLVESLEKNVKDMQALLADFCSERSRIEENIGLVGAFRAAERKTPSDLKNVADQQHLKDSVRPLKDQQRWEEALKQVRKSLGAAAPTAEEDAAKVVAELQLQREQAEQALVAFEREQAQSNVDAVQVTTPARERSSTAMSESPAAEEEVSWATWVPEHEELKAQDTDEGWRPAGQNLTVEDQADNTDARASPQPMTVGRGTPDWQRRASSVDDTDLVPEEADLRGDEKKQRGDARKEAVLVSRRQSARAALLKQVEGDCGEQTPSRQTSSGGRLEKLQNTLATLEEASNQPLCQETIVARSGLEKDALSMQIEILDLMMMHVKRDGSLSAQELLFFDDVTNLMNLSFPSQDGNLCQTATQDVAAVPKGSEQDTHENVEEREAELERRKKQMKSMKGVVAKCRQHWQDVKTFAELERRSSAGKAQPAQSAEQSVASTPFDRQVSGATVSSIPTVSGHDVSHGSSVGQQSVGMPFSRQISGASMASLATPRATGFECHSRDHPVVQPPVMIDPVHHQIQSGDAAPSATLPMRQGGRGRRRTGQSGPQGAASSEASEALVENSSSAPRRGSAFGCSAAPQLPLQRPRAGESVGSEQSFRRQMTEASELSVVSARSSVNASCSGRSPPMSGARKIDAASGAYAARGQPVPGMPRPSNVVLPRPPFSRPALVASTVGENGLDQDKTEPSPLAVESSSLPPLAIGTLNGRQAIGWRAQLPMQRQSEWRAHVHGGDARRRV